MPMVPKSAFENMTVDIPDIETQKKIIALDNLLEKERSFLTQLQERRNQLVNTICLKATRNKLHKTQEALNV